jgi:hypothetical protein
VKNVGECYIYSYIVYIVVYFGVNVGIANQVAKCCHMHLFITRKQHTFQDKWGSHSLERSLI